MLNRIHHADRLIYLSLVLLLLAFNPSSALAQGTSFTYQGNLSDGGTPATGNYDLQFKLFDTATLGTGSQQGAMVTVSTVAITAGIFSVQLDFGACASCFNGSPRFLEIAVKPTSGGTFTPLSPRQPITSTPYTIRSLVSTAADGLSVACVNCITSSQIQSVNGSAVSGTIPVASFSAGSPNYIQNTTSQQAAADFNISGNGTAGGTLAGNLLNATLQYNLGGSRVLSNAGTNNLFAGIGAGQANTTGGINAFFGQAAGYSNTTSGINSFFGDSAGYSNTTGFANAFFGNFAGQANTTGTFNAFFGNQAGQANTASSNSFFGSNAGNSNIMGTNNTVVGAFANVGFDNLNHATAIGADTIITASNRVQLGRNGIDTVSIGTLTGATSVPVCINGTVLSSCSSSGRYKDSVQPFTSGLNLLQRLRPVTFNWKGRVELYLGLIAEEVAAVEPLLITRNQKGEIEGVKYAQLNIVLINAIKEQQAQIEEQRQQAKQQVEQIKLQQREIAALKKLVCLDHPEAELCKP